MSWAAERKTTRVEDRDYCLFGLFGLFDINMPLLYGEGRKAFFRLQEELLKNSNEQSLFAWGIKSPLQHLDMDRKWPVDVSHEFLRTTGIFARSPYDFFIDSGEVRRVALAFDEELVSTYRPPPAIVNRGVRTEFPLLWNATKKRLTSSWQDAMESNPKVKIAIKKLDKLEFAIISCGFRGDQHNCLGIPLVPLGGWASYHAGFAVYGQLQPIVLVPQIASKRLKKSRLDRRLVHVDSYWVSDWCIPDSSLA